MITKGQTLTNPVTGETLVFRTTSAETNGERVVVEAYVEPDGAVAAAHVHPAQEECFDVLAGELEFRIRKQTFVARAGDRVLVPAETPHRFRNIGRETAHFTCEVRPALGFEQLIETMFSLAADGKVNKKGMPNPMRLAVIARHLEAQEKVRFEMHAMGTALEGEPEDIFALAAEVHALPFESGIPRVYTILKIDQRTDKTQTLESKVESVTNRL